MRWFRSWRCAHGKHRWETVEVNPGGGTRLRCRHCGERRWGLAAVRFL